MTRDTHLREGSQDHPPVAPAILLCVYLAAVLLLVLGYLTIVSGWTGSLLRMVGH
jgi:hypothetical protein